MSISLEQVVISNARLQRLEFAGNTTCYKCGKEMKINDKMMKKKVRQGKHRYYHLDCYERIFA